MNSLSELQKDPNITKIRIRHLRFAEVGESLVLMTPELIKLNKLKPHSKGGLTELHIIYSDKTHKVGTAVCSFADCYNKKVGIKLALERALK